MQSSICTGKVKRMDRELKRMDREELLKRLQLIEFRWNETREELRTARDWLVEAHLHFQLIDLKHAHKHILSLISALTAA